MQGTLFAVVLALLACAPMTMQVLLPTAGGAAFARAARTTLSRGRGLR